MSSDTEHICNLNEVYDELGKLINSVVAEEKELKVGTYDLSLFYLKYFYISWDLYYTK